MKAATIAILLAAFSTAIGSAVITGRMTVGSMVQPDGFFTTRDMFRFFGLFFWSLVIPACVAMGVVSRRLVRSPLRSPAAVSGLVAFFTLGLGASIFHPFAEAILSGGSFDLGRVADRIDLSWGLIYGVSLLPLAWPLSLIACKLTQRLVGPGPSFARTAA